LNKFLADHGVASRRACDELIGAGRVRINGRVVRDLGVRIDPRADEVRVDDEVLEPEKKVARRTGGRARSTS
jgi:23S rRNA pseudouridine2605 synthase